jgi:enoyl-CoA hydratase
LRPEERSEFSDERSREEPGQFMSEREADVLLVERSGLVIRLTLNRPDQLNAVGTATVQSVHRALDQLEKDDSVRAILLAGAGRNFSAGADIGELEQMSTPRQFRAFIDSLQACFDRLQHFGKPSVAAIQGVAYGGGLELALACDLRVAARDARLGVPEIKLGLLPGAGGTQRLPRLLPAAIAKQMVLTGEPLSGERAYHLGLVNELAEPGEVVSVAQTLATAVAAGAPLALAAGKHLVDAGRAMDLASAVTLERETVAGLFGTSDREEGLRAFRARKPPTFTGT